LKFIKGQPSLKKWKIVITWTSFFILHDHHLQLVEQQKLDYEMQQYIIHFLHANCWNSYNTNQQGCCFEVTCMFLQTIGFKHAQLFFIFYFTMSSSFHMNQLTIRNNSSFDPMKLYIPYILEHLDI
jgi:hypothetical protein